MGKRNKPPLGARMRVQAITVASTAPGNLPLMVGLTYADGTTAPDDIMHVSSATYSLGSPTMLGVQQIAVLSYSLGSSGIPQGLKRVAILPDT